MIEPLSDIREYRRRRKEAWEKCSSYWLSEPLRHVVDVGDTIASRVIRNCKASDVQATVVDMGCGSCWLAERLLQTNLQFSYIGIDSNPTFVLAAAEKYKHYDNVRLIRADVDSVVDLDVEADIVINSFNFFELADLRAGMANVSRWLKSDGTLLLSTIDKTYLILALSHGWDNFHENLRAYQATPGVKFDFQKVDLGNKLADEFEYPSVLYSTQDYLEAASGAGLALVSYVEEPFTAREIPKIYCHLEFRKVL